MSWLVESLESRRLLSHSSVVTAKLTDKVLNITGTPGADTIDVSESSDAVTVTSSGTSIYSGSAANIRGIVIRSKAGNDSITTSYTDPTISIVIYAGSGDDTLSCTGVQPTNYDSPVTFIFTKGDGNDSIQGDDSNFLVQPNSGDDTITLGNGQDVIYNGRGDNTVTLGNSSSDDIVLANPGDDITLGQGQMPNEVVSFKGADTINSTGDDEIFLQPDNILNGNSSDTIYQGKDSSSNLHGTSGATFYPRGWSKAERIIHQLREFKSILKRLIHRYS